MFFHTRKEWSGFFRVQIHHINVVTNARIEPGCVFFCSLLLLPRYTDLLTNYFAAGAGKLAYVKFHAESRRSDMSKDVFSNQLTEVTDT